MTRTKFILGLLLLVLAVCCHLADADWVAYIFWGGFVVLSTHTAYMQTAGRQIR